jgi:hypothetical protein
MSDLTSSVATYDLSGDCLSGLIADNFLFLGSVKNIIVYEISFSLTDPLKQKACIETSDNIYKMRKEGQEIAPPDWEERASESY